MLFGFELKKKKIIFKSFFFFVLTINASLKKSLTREQREDAAEIFVFVICLVFVCRQAVAHTMGMDRRDWESLGR